MAKTNIVFVNMGSEDKVQKAIEKFIADCPELAENSNYTKDWRKLQSVTTKHWSDPFIEITDNDYEVAKKIGMILNDITGLEVHIYDPVILPAKPKS